MSIQIENCCKMSTPVENFCKMSMLSMPVENASAVKEVKNRVSWLKNLIAN